MFPQLVLLLACSGTGKDGDDTGVGLAGPTLSHTPATELVEGTPTTLDVTATDPDGVSAVVVFHRIEGEISWIQGVMEQGEGDTWSIELEADAVDAPGLEYYFKATDFGDPQSSTYLPEDSTDDPFVVPVSVVGTPIPYTMDFEDPDDGTLNDLGWANSSLGFVGYGWAESDAQSNSPTRSAFHSRGYTGLDDLDDWLLAPALDFSAASSAQVTWYEYGSNVDEADHGLYVSVGSRDPADGDYVAVEAALPPPTEDAWGRSAIYDLSGYVGEPTVYLAWRFVGQDADDWYIDDIVVQELQADLTLDTSVSPSPIHPGESGTFTVSIENFATVDSDELSVSVSFPSGGASVAESSVSAGTIASGASGSADFTLSIDAATPDNSTLPVDVVVTDGTNTWTASDELLVGYASTAYASWTPTEAGQVEIVLGVGDPDAPDWTTTLYDGSVEKALTLEADITEAYAFLPPAAGDLRWWLTVDGDVAGTVDSFSISAGGETYEATVLPRTTADVVETVWLPEPPDYRVFASTNIDPLTPGASGVSLDLTVVSTGNDSSGPVSVTISSSDPDVTITSGGPFQMSDDVFEGGDEIDIVDAFTLDVSSAHTDSSDITLDVTFDDGVDVDVETITLPVPWPYLEISAIDIDDDGRDGVLDPDESASLTFTLINNGDLSTEGSLVATLSVESSSTAVATAATDEVTFRELASGRSDEADDAIDVEVTGGADGDTVDLLLTVVDDVRSYEVRTQLILGEPLWETIDASGDPSGDALDGWDFDIAGGEYRVDDGVLQLRLESYTVFDPDMLFIESWGYSTVADWTYYRLVLQSGVASVEGYDGSFTIISNPVVSYPSATEVQLDITVADLGLSLDSLSLGFASGWCGPDEYYCDHFPDGWGYPYDSWNPSAFYDLSW